MRYNTVLYYLPVSTSGNGTNDMPSSRLHDAARAASNRRDLPVATKTAVRFLPAFLLIALLLLSCMAPDTACAEGDGGQTPIGALDFTNPATPSSGEGYAWDSGAKTLALSGVNVHAQGRGVSALTVPSGTTIKLEPGTSNTLTSLEAGGIFVSNGNDGVTLEGEGSLTITAASDGIGASSGTVLVHGACSLFIDAGENGVYVLDGSIALSSGAFVDVRAGLSGLATGVSLFGDDGVFVETGASATIDAGQDGILSGGLVKIDGAGLITVAAGNNAIFSDTEASITDSAGIVVTSGIQGVYASEGASVKGTPLDIATTSACVSAGYTVELDGIEGMRLSPGESGIALVSDAIKLTGCTGSIVGAARGFEIFGQGAVELAGTSLDVEARGFCVADTLSLMQGSSVRLAASTASDLPASAIWTIDETSSLVNGGSFSNGGSLVVGGTFTNNGTYTAQAGSSLGGTGSLQAGAGAKVILPNSTDAVQRELLARLGTLFFIVDGPLDFTDQHNLEQGDGYAWDPVSKTLTLSGATIRVASEAGGARGDVPAVRLPDGSSIHLVSGTISSIDTDTASGAVICGEGDLSVFGTGMMQLNGRALAMQVGGTLDVWGSTLYSTAFSGIAANRIDIACAQVAVSSQSGPCLTALEHLSIEKAGVHLTTQGNPLITGESVIRVPATAQASDASSLISIDQLPSGYALAVFQDDYLGLFYAGVDDGQGDPALTLAIDGYAPGHTVSFVSNAGIDIPRARVVAGDFVAEPPIERDGYVLGGWSRDPEGSDRYDYATPVYEDLTLHAQWTASPVPESPSENGATILPKVGDGFGFAVSGFGAIAILAGAFVLAATVRRRFSANG